MDEQELEIRELMIQSDVLYSQSQYEEAIIKLNKALEMNPKNVKVMFKKAESFIMLDQVDEARKLLNQIAEIDDGNGEIYFHLGNIAFIEGNTLDGKAYMTKAIQSGFINENVYINLGIAEEQDGHFDNAIRYYNKASHVAPHHLLSKTRKIQLLHVLNRDDEALLVSKKLMNDYPHVFEGYHYTINIYIGKKKLAEAKKVLSQALELFPDDLGFRFDEIKILEAEEKYQEALDLLEKELPQDNEIVMREKIDLLIMLDRAMESREIIIHHYHQTHDDSYLVLIYTILMAEEDYDEIIKLANEYINEFKNGEQYYATLYYKSLAYLRKNETEVANEMFKENIKEFRMAGVADPSRTDLQVYRIVSHKERKEYDKALELLDYLLKIKNDSGELYKLKADILKSQGSYIESEKAIEMAKSLGSIV